MPISFDPGNTNRLLNSITKNRANVGSKISQIASGTRLVKAGVDAAGLAISEQLKSEIAAMSQSVKNVETGANFIRVAEGGLSNVSDLIARGRELSLQAANGTLGDSERQTLNQEFQQILTEIDRVSQTQEFNGQPILDGNLSPSSPNQINIQSGTGSGPENQINLNVIENTSTLSLGINGLDISTAAGALNAFQPLEQAQQTVVNTRGEVGAVSNRLSITAETLKNSIVNLSASQEQIAGTDFAKTISDLNSSLIQLESSIRSLGIQARQNESGVGRILNINT